MLEKNILLLRIFCIAVTLGLISLFTYAAQGDSDILSSLTEDEVLIELFRSKERVMVKGQKEIDLGKWEKVDIDIKGEKPSCIAKARKGIKVFAKNENEKGIFAIDGIIIKKTPEYVIFKGKVSFISKDKTLRREITLIQKKLIKGKNHVLGGIGEVSGEADVILMKAIW